MIPEDGLASDPVMGTVVSKQREKDEVDVWMKRFELSTKLQEAWEKECRVADCYRYWRGRQRENEYDESGDRRAQHNKIHPDVAEDIPSKYFYNPVGRVVAAPSRVDTPGETVSEKARLLQDTGVFLVQDKSTGFYENTHNALKESYWAFGCVEVGYSPDFVDNPMADRPSLKEKKDTKVPESSAPLEAPDLTEMEQELSGLQQSLRGETFYVKHIPAKQVLVSPSNKNILEENDWVGYWEDYPLEDIKRSPAYSANTQDLKASPGMEQDSLGNYDRVRLFRIWNLREKVKYVFAKNHERVLARLKFDRCPLKFYRPDRDPYNFHPIPPIFLKLPSQDGYNDSAEYLRRMRNGTTPRYTYDEEAIEAEDARKFMSREFGVMIPRRQGTHNVIEPVNQPSTAAGAIQTLALAEKEFEEADSASGDPLNPATQTATRVMVANAKQNSEESFERDTVARWLASIIEELIMLAVDFMSLPKWIAMNVDMDSPLAMQEAMLVAKTYQQIDAEKLRDATLGIRWHIEVDAESLSPVSEAERGKKMMQVITFLANPAAAALMAAAPALLKRMLRLGGITMGEDVDAIKQALQVIVAMNMARTAPPPGISPQAGEPSGPVVANPSAPPAPPELPIPPGLPA